MAKKVIKEIIIVLLLCLAIILVLGVLLYEYVPSNKMIPDKVSYTTPQAVQEELSKSEDVEDERENVIDWLISVRKDMGFTINLVSDASSEAN